jgi:hypothetical protein
MTKRRQEWTPDTLSHMTFVQEWDDADDENNRTHICVEVHNRTTGEVITDPQQCADLHEKHLTNNQYKNAVLVPAILAVLPADEKKPVLDRRGIQIGETFAFDQPEFHTDENDEIALKAWGDTAQKHVDAAHEIVRATKAAGKAKENAAAAFTKASPKVN